MTERELHIAIAERVGGTLSEGHSKHRTGETWNKWEWLGPLGVVAEGISRHPLSSSHDAIWLACRLGLVIDASGKDEAQLRRSICELATHPQEKQP